MAEKKNQIHSLPQTRGYFELVGTATGLEKAEAYRESLTKTTQKPWRTLSFGVTSKPGTTHYLHLSSGERDTVFFSKREKVKENGKEITKNVTERVPWADRFDFGREGYRLIGVNVGVTKKIDESGKEKNDSQMMTEYDATLHIKNNLCDGSGLFTKGKVEFSSFTDDKGNKRASMKLVPSQVSLMNVDFDREDFEERAEFVQTIIFMGIQPTEDKSEFVVSAKIVNYSSIEDAEFFIQDKALAQKFRSSLKPYWAIQVSGNLVIDESTEQIEDEDQWGETNSMTRLRQPVKRKLVITGAKGNTLDKTVYSEQAIDEALEAITAHQRVKSDFGDTGGVGLSTDWGSVKSGSGEDEDAPW